MLLNQYSPVPRARSSIAGKDATRAQIYAGLGSKDATDKFIYLSIYQVGEQTLGALGWRTHTLRTIDAMVEARQTHD